MVGQTPAEHLNPVPHGTVVASLQVPSLHWVVVVPVPSAVQVGPLQTEVE
jgi:hypothetical protein